MTASLASIQRHPLKSHGREALEHVILTAGAGMVWDRHWAVAHEAAKLTAGEWGACANFSRGSKAPNLMAINARLNETTSELTLTHPDRPDITFRPDDTTEAARFVDWVLPLCPADRALPTRIFTVPGRGMTDTDYPSVSLISLPSNRALSAHMGIELSPLRWRGNFWLDGLDAFEERAWVGRKLRLGGALLWIEEPKERCLATTANPETGERDADTLQALRALHGDQDFGLYAKVLESGPVRIGDRAELLP
ncbi:MAG: MOSC N-terminal beta barrel domain-containing protein [Albidovulum sp.]